MSTADAVMERRGGRARPSRHRVLGRLARRPAAWVGAAILLLFVGCAVWPQGWLPHDPYASEVTLRLLPPRWVAGGDGRFPLGTDSLGRDALSRMMLGARYTGAIVAVAAALSLVAGVAAGLVAGYYQGWLGDVILRLVDIQLAFPLLVLAVALVAAVGPSLPNLVLVLAISGWAPYVRLARGLALSLRESVFIEAARSLGAGDVRIIARHLLPNAASPIVIYLSFELARLVLLEAALSYLGLGIQPPSPSWGSMIADAQKHLVTSPWTAALPGAAIVLLVLAINLIGDELRDALDARSAAR